MWRYVLTLIVDLAINPFTLRAVSKYKCFLWYPRSGAWDTVCRNGFDQSAANIAFSFNDLGYPNSSLVLTSITFASGTGPV